MTDRTLTPLSTITGFDAALLAKLADPYWITTAEEFHSLIRFSGRKAVAAALSLDEARVGLLATAVSAVLPQDTPFASPIDMEVGDGLIMDGVPGIDADSFAAVIELPDVVEPLTKAKGIPDPQNQGKRNTCVAFSLASIIQILSGDPTDLSEQFLYYLCKEKDGIKSDAGTKPDLAFQLLRDVGICTEITWPYHPEPDSTQPGGPQPPDPAYTEAKHHRITGFTQLPPKGMAGLNQIKSQLAQGKPVMIGMPIYGHWTGSTQGTLLGRLRFPLPSESPLGGHAMCVVGYRDDASAPGGGYFIVRNSWGTEWGKDNEDGPGYCHMPYKLVSQHNMVAFVADGVVTDTIAKPVVTPIAAPSIATSARLGSAAGGGDNLMAVYADLLALRDQVDGLASRLQSLLGIGPPALPDVVAPPVVATPPAPVAPEPVPAPIVLEPVPAPIIEETIPYIAPLVFINTGAGEKSEELYPNGIDGTTGQALLKIDEATAAKLATGQEAEPSDLKEAYGRKQIHDSGTIADVDQNMVAEGRWAVVVSTAEGVDVIKAIWPLIQHRMRQMEFRTLDFDFQSGDTNCGVWLGRHTDGFQKNLKDNWGEIPPVLLVRPGEETSTWLARHGTSQAPVDPSRGVPFYLMIVGRPGPLDASDQAFISLNFQYELDVFWGVGRLIFSDENGRHRYQDYQTYAERVVAWETRADAASRLRKEIAFFGTKHEDDNSTIRSANELVVPLVNWSKTSKLTTRMGFGQTVCLGDDATRNNLAQLLSASTPPALLFTASHGIGLPMSDPARLVLNQGALVTADFEFGSIKREHWLAGEDLDALSSANLEGMIAFLFACYGAGCPQKDEFVFDANKKRQQIAPFPFIAQLPQRMLAKGALAVLGHVERAWTYSFSGTESNTTSQIQPFQDVLGRLVRGMPVGSATDQFNVVQGARAIALAEELDKGYEGSIPNSAKLAKLWMARNDARNYALLGDPAVKLAI